MKQYTPPAPPADQDAAWDKVVKALAKGGADDDLPEGDDLPDDPEGHLVFMGETDDPRS